MKEKTENMGESVKQKNERLFDPVVQEETRDVSLRKIEIKSESL